LEAHVTAPDTSITQSVHNSAQFRRLIELGFSGGDVAIVDEVVSVDVVEHQAGVRPPDREGVKRLITYLHQGLPDLTVSIEDSIALGDKVWARLRAHGTHLGTFMGVAPTGKHLTVEIIDICRFANGQMVEHWGYTDRMATMEQLGAGPLPA
jgi:predicted ester cyclase